MERSETQEVGFAPDSALLHLGYVATAFPAGRRGDLRRDGRAPGAAPWTFVAGRIADLTDPRVTASSGLRPRNLAPRSDPYR